MSILEGHQDDWGRHGQVPSSLTKPVFTGNSFGGREISQCGMPVQTSGMQKSLPRERDCCRARIRGGVFWYQVSLTIWPKGLGLTDKKSTKPASSALCNTLLYL